VLIEQSNKHISKYQLVMKNVAYDW